MSLSFMKIRLKIIKADNIKNLEKELNNFIQKELTPGINNTPEITIISEKKLILRYFD